ncbi:hypothetical protein ACFL6U_16365 [Planctomycetota bacterium]
MVGIIFYTLSQRPIANIHLEDMAMRGQDFFRLLLGILTSLLLCSRSQGQSIVARPVFAQQVNPANAGISFEQTTFGFDAGIVTLTDWGRMSVHPDTWSQATRLDTGFINVFFHAFSSSAAPAQVIWTVQNFHVPASLTDDCATAPPPAGFDPATTSGPSAAHAADSTIPPPPPTGIIINAAPVGPRLACYFDLRPNTLGSGRVDSLVATVLVSAQPLPVTDSILALAEGYTPTPVAVTQGMVNAEGDWGEFGRPLFNPNRKPDLIGPPPIPLPPVPIPDYPADLDFPLGTFQDDSPNVDCAWNQCVPMAHANVLGYLEKRYNGSILTWNLIHALIPGIGKVDAAGDVPFWTPIPANSVVAQIDTRTQRLGVINPDVGDPTLTRCHQIRGLFGYLNAFGGQARTVYRHQGSTTIMGAGNTCDNGTVPLSDITSQREGIHPTWEWIFDQLQKGRGVAMSFGRYQVDGTRTSGHMVRVWGAARHLGIDYLFTLDDSDQGDNVGGTINTEWQVADTRGPTDPGNPDGRLNLSNTSSEIEFAISAEAKPTLNIP